MDTVLGQGRDVLWISYEINHFSFGNMGSCRGKKTHPMLWNSNTSIMRKTWKQDWFSIADLC